MFVALAQKPPPIFSFKIIRKDEARRGYKMVKYNCLIWTTREKEANGKDCSDPQPHKVKPTQKNNIKQV